MADSGPSSEKRFVASCPVCAGRLEVARLACGQCGTQIETRLDVPAFFRLPPDLQHFVRIFLNCRGNIREVEKRLGISYPTVNKRLDVINAVLEDQSAPRATGGGRRSTADTGPLPEARSRRQVLAQLENGEINAQQAAKMLKQLENQR